MIVEAAAASVAALQDTRYTVCVIRGQKIVNPSGEYPADEIHGCTVRHLGGMTNQHLIEYC